MAKGNKSGKGKAEPKKPANGSAEQQEKAAPAEAEPQPADIGDQSAAIGDQPSATGALPASAGAKKEGEENKPPPLRSVHTTSFAEILKRLGSSLWVTTYQAGKLVVLRQDGGLINTHFRGFQKPMGMAIAGDRLAIGTAMEIWEFHNVPAVIRRLDNPEKHDACFMPRSGHVTGDIQIHEMCWVGQELWFVNTRFSCLCTLDRVNSFVPRWRPPFITGIAPEDRCHLNGLCLVDGKPKYVTALGETDTQGGWRDNKKSGGVLMDITTNEIVVRGLSMPHSPRYHNGKIWILESGRGGIGYLDSSGKYVNVADLPGFTRGFDIVGNLAFIGLSQVRESAIFSGIAIAERPLEERSCGIWVVDLNNGQIVAFLKFEDAVQEIFAVQLMPGRRFPDLLNDNRPLLADSFVVPDEVLTDVPEAFRHKTN